MNAGDIFPKLRDVDIFPAEVSGQTVFCLRDPLNLSQKVLFLPYPVFFIVSLFDGNHSLVDIQAEYMRRFGELIYREKIQGLVEQLEENFLLEGDRYREAERKIIEAFLNAPIRPMALAGEAYEENPQKVQEMIEAYFAEPEGPGLPTAGKGTRHLVGAIAPHIDYCRGGHCYAWAHKAIQESSDAELFVILGTAHSATKRPFALMRKDFQTPWGPVETDRPFLAELQSLCSFDFYEDEFAHKTEHSIELQLIFLRALRKNGSFQIVPVLCGSFHQAILQDISPMQLPEVGQFIEGLKKVLAGSKKKICLLASADLAHVGQRFGDAQAPNHLTLQSLAAHDRHLLGFAERLDAEGFYHVIRREKDCQHICGFPPIYTLLCLLQTQEGKLLKYAQSQDPATGSAVTFASLAFFS